MAALSTFAELMARASATVFSQLCNNALEKAQQQAIQQQQQNGDGASTFPLLLPSPIIAVPPSSSISPKNIAKISTEKSNEPTKKDGQQQQQRHQQQENSRKRKRAASAVATPNQTPPNDDDEPPCIESAGNVPAPPLLGVPRPVDRQPSNSPLSASRISSPDSISAHKARKLKLYAAEEKTDIIDYAKCIGNRAAGREFNVAESSIREWRKNEEKIRRQAETTAGCTQHFEKQRQGDMLADIDEALVRMLNAREKRCSTWYGIGEQANLLWREAANNAGMEGSEMKITMGWVSRFMRRNEQRVPKIAPPIIATANAAIGSPSSSLSPSMVRRSTILDSILPPVVETRAKARSKAKAAMANGRQEGQGGVAPVENDDCARQREEEGGAEKEKLYDNNGASSSSRRKRFRPMRVDATCATLLTTTTVLPEIGEGGGGDVKKEPPEEVFN